MGKRLGEKKQKYTFDQRKQVVEKYLQGELVDNLVEEFQLSNRGMVYDWVKKVKANGYAALNDQRGLRNKGKKKEEPTLEEKYERVCLENQYLKKLLDLKRG